MVSFRLNISVAIVALSCIACANDNNSGAPGPPTPQSSPVASATVTPDEFAAVRTTFKVHCSECHGDTGDGGRVKVEGKQLKVPSFKVGHALKHSDEDYVEQVRQGGDGMPPFKDKLKPNEITDLIRFIRKEFQGK
jgi:mono/diheme cytochrome c family protein